MKSLNSTQFGLCIFGMICLFALLLACSTSENQNELNPIVGTWVITVITYDGERYDETGYSTFTKGGFWTVQLKTPNKLNLTEAPQTLEEYQSVLNSYKASFGTYKLKGDSCYCYDENDLKPQNVGNVIPGKYKIENDILIFDVGKWRYTWERQE